MTQGQNPMENDTEFATQEGTEETVNDAELDLDLSDDSSEDVEALKKKLATAEAQKEHWRKKANEKGEKVEVKTEVKTNTEPSQEVSYKDSLLLAKADVDIEDVDEVIDFARFRKISISEALKNQTMQAILKDRKEERLTSLATQTKSSKKSTQPSNGEIIEKAKKNFYDLTDAEIDKLAEARMEAKLRK